MVEPISLSASEADMIFDSLPSILLMMNFEGELVYWNDNAEALTGYSSEEVKRMRAEEFIRPSDRLKLQAAIRRVEEGRNEGAELYLLTSEGEEIPYFWRAREVQMKGQNLMLVVGLDISQNKETERELKAEKRFVDTLIDSLPGIFYVLDEDLNYLRWNQNLAKEVGYSDREIAEMHPLDFYSEEYHDLIRTKIEEVFREGEAEVEVEVTTQDGEQVPYYLRASLFERDGKKFLVGTGHNIAMQKKYEREMQDSLREKHVLLLEIHHRVKNNLAVISGLIQLQLFEVEDSEAKRILQESQNRIQTMALIHEKLYSSRSLARISLEDYIDELLGTLRDTLGSPEKRIAIRVDVGDVELTINRAVPFALLLNEIVSNSFEHAFPGREEGSITVHVDERDTRIIARIEDDGVGLKRPGGLQESGGLGFSLIKNFLDQLDAEWEVSSSGGVKYRIAFDKSDTRGSVTTLTEQ